MRLGIFAGGFKPFHVGHFTRLCQAIDTCDKTYIFYGAASRSKGSKFNFTEENAESVFSITSAAIKKAYGDKVEIVKSSNPVTSAYDLIIENHNSENTVCVYGRDADLSKYYLTYVGTQKEEKYFGSMITESRLVFNGTVDESRIQKYFPDKSKEALYDFATLSGTQFRKNIDNFDLDALFDSLPPILSLRDKVKIVSDLTGKFPKPFTINHIDHPYEVLGFTINEMHDLINDVATLNVCEMQEKMDGQNLTFTVRDKELVLLSKGPDITRVLNSSKNRRQISEEYSHLPGLKKSFLWAMDLLEPVALKNSHLFRDGLVVVESALLHEASANTIQYKNNEIRLINPCTVIGGMTFDEEGFEKLFDDFEKSTNGKVLRVPHIESIKDCPQSFLHSLHDQLRAMVPASDKTVGGYLISRGAEYLRNNTQIHPSLIIPAAERLVTGHKKKLTMKMCMDAGKEEWTVYREVEKNRAAHMMQIREPLEKLLCELHHNIQQRFTPALICVNRDDIDTIAYADPRKTDNTIEAECLWFLRENFELMDYTEGIVFHWRGRILKLTGNFTRLNRAKWINMRREG